MNETKAREALEVILGGNEYQRYYQEKSTLQHWWEMAKQWISEQLSKLFPSIESVSGAAEPILILTIAGVIILLGFIIFSIIRNGRRKIMYRENTPLQSRIQLKWTYQMHMNEAMKFEKTEQFSLATRHLFLGLLLYFHEQKWLEARIWKTNWEYYEELRKVKKEWAVQFNEIAHIFDEVTYGERMINREEHDKVKIAVMKLIELAEISEG